MVDSRVEFVQHVVTWIVDQCSASDLFRQFQVTNQNAPISGCTGSIASIKNIPYTEYNNQVVSTYL